MKNIILILIFIGAMISCKSKQQSTIIDNSIFNRKDADSLFLTIDRSPCFGRCPHYEAKIYESGYGIYIGKRDVGNIGTYSFQLTAEQLRQLKDKATEINYMELKDKYDMEGVTDLPETNTSVQLNGERKKIKNRYAGPDELNRFEKAIDAVLDEQEMKKFELPINKKD